MKLRLFLLVCLVVWALPSFGQTLWYPPCPTPFNPAVDSDAMAVCAPNGTLYDYLSVTEANENPGTIYTLATPPDPTQWGFATTLCEFAPPAPCGPGLPQQYYSDIFGVASNGVNYYLAFSSDGENGSPFGGQGFYYWQAPYGEPAGWLSATMYLDPTLQAQGYTAWFISQTPEPTTLLLIGSGISLLAAKLRKK
jgi:PEP-CTERM motif-containing protein